jgi:hypothetical protein
MVCYVRGGGIQSNLPGALNVLRSSTIDFVGCFRNVITELNVFLKFT